MIRKWAVGSIILNFLASAIGYVTYFQTQYQLVSDFIPQTVVSDIAHPYMVTSLVAIMVSLAAFVLFLYSKYTYAVAICATSLLFQQLYLIFFVH